MNRLARLASTRSAALALAAALAAGPVLSGCSSRAGSVVAGGAVVGAAYEYKNKRALDHLEREFSDGRITQSEYQRRRREIEGGSLIY